MRIAFVTGSLDPGRDGVGDYTRALAAACRQLGHAVRLVALADGGTTRPSGEDEADMLRISADEWRGDSGRRVEAWVKLFDPDWVSLQFVPYSFDPRGLFGRAVAPLARLGQVAPHRHVCFHEIWIGSFRGAPLKTRIIGWIQRRAVARLLARMQPQRVHTNTTYYRAALATLGVEAKLLPMFGSVPRVENPPGSRVLLDLPPSSLVCGHFGTLHPDWEAESFFGSLADLSARAQRAPVFVVAGDLRTGESLYEELAVRWRGRVEFRRLGRLSPAELSAAFARFDFAVTSVPWLIAGKSSSAAALREHGLKVVVTAEGSPPRFSSSPLAAVELDEGFVPFFRESHGLDTVLSRIAPRPGVGAVAQQFLADLEGSAISPP